MSRLFERLAMQRRTIALAFVGLASLGILALFQLPAAILPDVTFPRITVIAESGERPGAEVLRSVTRPLEDAIRRVPGVLEMRSTTSRGSVELNLDCAWGSDLDLTLQRVQAEVEAARAEFPPGTLVDARQMNPTLFPVLGYSLVSETRSLAALRDLAVTVLKPELERLPGVAEVKVQGGRRPEARVTLDLAALAAQRLKPAMIADALRSSADLRSVGLSEANDELYLGLVDARVPDLEGLRSFLLQTEGGPPVPLGSLGRVTLEDAPEFVRYAAQSREAVLVNLTRKPSSSTVALADGARRWFREHAALLPPDVKVETFYDQSDLVRSSIDSVRDSLMVGSALAFLIVVLFLRNLRLGLPGGVVLPGSIALTLLGLRLTGQSLNMMTLGGIAAAVGLVLDDAIVVVEHLAHAATENHAKGGGTSRSVAMAEVLPTLVGSSLCTVSIFLPFVMLGGVTGAFFKVLALSMVFMLTASLLLCITVLPLLVGFRPLAAREPGPSRFDRLLMPMTRRWWLGLISVLLCFGASIPLLRTLGSGFLPEMDEGSLILDYVAPPGTSVTETDRALREIEREIAATPDIAAWSRRQGDQLGFFVTESNIGDYVLRLRPRRRRSGEEIADDLRARIEMSKPQVEIEFGQLVEDVIGDLTSNPQPIEIRVFGEDKALIESKAREAAEIAGAVRGVVDVKDGVVVSGPNLSILPTPYAARLGLTIDDLTDAVTPAVDGLEAGSIPRGAREWPIRVVLPRPAGNGPTALAELAVPIDGGATARLGDLALLRVEPGETEISRDDQRTMVSVTARLAGRDLGSAMAEIQKELRSKLVLPRGMTLRFGGLWAQQQSSFRDLAGVLLAAAVAVILILLASFRSWRRAIAVMLVVAASLTGVLAALHVGGATWNISSFVGAIMTVGIVGENAYFLVAAQLEARRSGHPWMESARLAARRRLRPVLMTTVAGVAALAPLALGLGSGSALLRPLALAVVGGFVLSAPLLLLVLPSLLGGIAYDDEQGS